MARCEYLPPNYSFGALDSRFRGNDGLTLKGPWLRQDAGSADKCAFPCPAITAMDPGSAGIEEGRRNAFRGPDHVGAARSTHLAQLLNPLVGCICTVDVAFRIRVHLVGVFESPAPRQEFTIQG